MATFTAYADAACTQVIGSGFVGEYFEIYGRQPSINVHEQTRTIDDKTVRFDQIQGFAESSVQNYSEATEIPITPTATKELQTIYFTPDTKYSFYCWGSAHAYYFQSGSFAARFDGHTWENVTAISDNTYGTYYDVSGLCFRTGSGAHYDSSSFIAGQFFGVDFVSITAQGEKSTFRCVIACSPQSKVFIESDAQPYKPSAGSKRRGGTGSGYYPNSVLPALPTASINTAFANVLGVGNGLTYYKLTGDCLEKITEFLYDTVLNLKFRNSQFRDAIASMIFIPYNVDADQTNTLKTIYLASKPIYPNDSCDFILRPLREIDFGSVSLTAGNIGFKGYADYVHTTAVLYLPCFGAVNIDMSALANGMILLRAVIDVRNGNILYRVETQGEEDETPVLYGQYAGSCGIPVPIGGANNSPAILGAVSSIGTVAVGLATGNPLNLIGGISGLASQSAPDIDTSGAVQPACAALGTPVPVLQIRKHILSAPPLFEEIAGIPSDGSTDGEYSADIHKLSDYSGFLQCSWADVSGLDCTDSEKAEIEQLLREGVYL